MRRLLITLTLSAFCAPLVGDVGAAEAQVWKVKKNKAGTGKTAAKPKPRPTRTARPAVKRKKKRPEKRKVELVPDENEPATTDAREPREDEQPIFIQVEEVFD